MQVEFADEKEKHNIQGQYFGFFTELVKFSSEPLLSPSDLLTPNAASLPSSNGFLSNHEGKVLPSDLSKILLKNSRLHSSLDHINRAAPGSPGPVTRPRSRTLPQSEVLPPVCITSDYHSRNNTPDIPGWKIFQTSHSLSTPYYFSALGRQKAALHFCLIQAS